MGITDSLKDAYFKMEDKWYALVDRISDTFPAFGNAVDAVEERGIPSLPLAVATILAVLFCIYLIIAIGGGSAITFTVTDADKNPLANANITVFVEGEAKQSVPTGQEGKVTIYLANGDYQIKIDKENFSPQTIDYTVSGNDERGIILLPQETTISKLVKLQTANGALIPGSGTVVYSCEETGETGSANYSNGQFNAVFNNPCQTISVESVSGYEIRQGRISFSGTYNTVEVEEKEVNTGRVIVNLTSASGDTPIHAGIRVMLVSVDSSVLPMTQLTQQTLSVEFAEVPTGTYHVVVSDPEGKFAEYDSSSLEQSKAVSKDGTTTFNVTLQKSASATLNITVLDADTGVPVLGAEVALIMDSLTLNTDVTGATGQVSFKIVEGSIYSLQVSHPDYMIATEPVVSSAKPNVQINIVKANEANSRTLTVLATDPDGEIVGGAKVFLRKADETQVGEPKVTGADGKVSFFNLELGETYYAYVIKEGFEGANSPTIQITPRVENLLRVTLNIGKGTVNVNVMDSDRATISGATVTAVDYFTGKTVSQSASNTTGLASFEIRADKKVYFTAEASGYMKYFTSAIYPDVGAPIEKEIVMMRETGSLSAEIMGIYSGANLVSGGDNQSIAQGTYIVKAVLTVPKGSFSEAGLHLRTGKAEDGATGLMEEDALYLGRIVSSATKTIRGTSYSPPNGYDVDQKNLTSGNSKWADSVWKNPGGGTYEVEAELVITSTEAGTPLDLWYRAWAKGSSVLRYPPDTPQQELYAKAKRYILAFDATNVCIGSFCRSYYIETLTGSEKGKRTYIDGTFAAQKDTNYALVFTLTNNSSRTISGAALTVEGKSLAVSEIIVDGKESESPVNLGNLDRGSFNSGRIVFSATSSGTATIRLMVNSVSKNEFDETITVNVAANKKFSLSLLPRQIIPYITNTLFFEVTDGNEPVGDAVIEIYSGKSLVGTVETTGEGLAEFDLEAPMPGKIIKIVAKKEGYDDFELEKTADEQILTVVPPEIEGTIKIGEVTGLEQEVILENGTVRDLKVESADFEGDMESLLTIGFESQIEGTKIASGADKNFTLLIKIKKDAYRLEGPKTVTGKMIIDVGVLDTTEGETGSVQTFTTAVPVSIRLTLPGYIESDGCLQVTPGSIEFITGGDEAVQTIEIENLCSADGIDIPLHSIEAKLKDDSKFGKVSVAGTGTGFGSAVLSTKFSAIADFMEKGAKETLTIRFTPSKAVDSGKQETAIEFRGKNTPEEGIEEFISAKVNLKVTMSNLSQCVEIQEPAGGVVLEVAGFNLGYNRYIGTNYAPTVSAYAMTYQGFTDRGGMTNPYGMGYGYGGGLPFSNYDSQNTDAYELNSFVIKNNCAGDVEIDLDPDSRVSVDEEKFTVSANNDHTVTVSPGYTLGRYKIKVNAKAAGTEDSLQQIGNVTVTVRRLGETDDDCIKISTSKLRFNSFIQSPQTYKVYNYCYDLGTMLSRDPNAVSVSCTPQYSPLMQGYQAPYLMYGQEQLYNSTYPLNTYGGAYPMYTGAAGTDLVSYPGMRNNYPPYYYGWGSGYTGSSYANNYNNYSSMYDYIRPNGTCIQNNCQMVSGTQIINRRLTQGGPNGSIEELIFQVMPSMNYIPQRQVYTPTTQTYSPISSILMLQNFASGANTLTNLYGTINVEYTNSYGSEQCKNFPVQIEDNWNLLSLVDSAMLWGSNSAEPGNCVEPSALDIVSYWKKRGSLNGVIPDSSFKGANYLHIADPPAIRVGGGTSSVSIFNIGISPSGGKCGLNDSLTNIRVGGGNTYGVTIKAETVSASSSKTGVFGGGKGVNLAVEINRSGLKSNCAYIEVPVTATLKRAINMKSAEVSWTLKVLVAKEGYKFGSLEECENGAAAKTKEDCLRWLGEEKAKDGGKKDSEKRSDQKLVDDVIAAHSECKGVITASDVSTASAKLGACSTNANDYGFSRIDAKESLSGPVKCDAFFCNNIQAQAFLITRYKEIEDKINPSDGSSVISCPDNVNNDGKTLKTLYKEAKKETLGICGSQTGVSLYAAEDEAKGLVTMPYKTPSGILTDDLKQKIAGMGNDSAASMITLLDKIIKENSADADKLVIEVADATNSHEDTFNALKMKKIGSNYYLPIKNYKALLEEINKLPSTDNCKKNDVENCQVTVGCINTQPITLKTADIKYLAENGNLKKAILENTADKDEIEQIYKQNPKLGEIHALADFNMLLTKLELDEKEFADWAGESKIANSAQAVITFMEDHKLAPLTGSKEIGRYRTELDYQYCKTGSGDNKVEMSVTLGTKETVKDAPKAEKNILLQKGYKMGNEITSSLADIENSKGGIAINEKGIYMRVPVKIEVTTSAGETSFTYELKDRTSITGAPSELITWYTPNNAIFAKGKISGTKYSIGTVKPGSATVLKGIYYYPDNGSLVFEKGKAGELSINAYDVIGMGNGFSSSSSIVQTSGTLNTPKLEQIIEYVKEKQNQKACIAEDGGSIYWNEEYLVK